MSLVIVNPYDNSIIDKISDFEKEKNDKLYCLDYLKQVSKELTKDVYKLTKENSININETIINMTKQKVCNLCNFTGTKDNKLVELNIYNLKEGNNESNRKFIRDITNYAFKTLNAETVTILSNKINDETVIDNGYETIGEYNGINTYIKDKEKEEEIGKRRK